MPDGSFMSTRGHSAGTTHRQNLIASVYLTHKPSPKSQLNFDASYIGYANDNPALLTFRYFDREGNDIVPSNPIFNYGISAKCGQRRNIILKYRVYPTKYKSVDPDEHRFRGGK